MGDEPSDVLYSGPSGTVTRTLARLNERSIPIKQIGSVSLGGKRQGSLAGGIVALVGLGLAIASLFFGGASDANALEHGWQPDLVSFGALILGGVLFVFGAAFVAGGGPKHAVTIDAGGVRIVVRAKDVGDAFRIRAAIESAIAD